MSSRRVSMPSSLFKTIEEDPKDQFSGFIRRKINKGPRWLGGGALCVQMDFTRTFEANAKCNNINHVLSHFYKFLVVLKYHRRLWANIFDTDISRRINTYIKVVYLAFFGYLCPYKCLCQRYWLMGIYGSSKLLKFYRNDFKHDLYCCIWLRFEMST